MTPPDAMPSPDRSVPPAPGEVRPFHLPPIRTGRLANGMELRSMQRGHVPLVSVSLVLDAGEATAPPGREGIAVLTGDALEGGTARRSGAELAEAFERQGAALRTLTGWDATTVGFTCVAERLDAVLGLVAEVVREPAFPEEEVERVRREHLATLRQRAMDPGSLADDALDLELFGPGHPYRRPLTGTEASLGSVGAGEVRDFGEERLAPSGGGLVVVGDLSEEEVEAMADRHFGSWQKAVPEAPPVPDPPVRRRREVVVVSRPGSVQSELRIGLAGPGRGDPDEVPLRVANSVLGGAFSSRLNMRLREQHGFTYGVHSSFSMRRRGGVFAIETAVQTEVTAAALSAALEVFHGFVEEGPSPEELERARDYLAGVFPLRMETTAQLAARLGELLVYRLPDDHHHRWRDRIRGVQVEDAAAALRRHLRPAEAVIVIVGDPDRVVPEVEALGAGGVRVVGA